MIMKFIEGYIAGMVVTFVLLAFYVGRNRT